MMDCQLCKDRAGFIQRGKAGTLTNDDYMTLCNIHWRAIQALVDVLSMSEEEFEAWWREHDDISGTT